MVKWLLKVINNSARWMDCKKTFLCTKIHREERKEAKKEGNACEQLAQLSCNTRTLACSLVLRSFPWISKQKGSYLRWLLCYFSLFSLSFSFDWSNTRDSVRFTTFTKTSVLKVRRKWYRCLEMRENTISGVWYLPLITFLAIICCILWSLRSCLKAKTLHLH